MLNKVANKIALIILVLLTLSFGVFATISYQQNKNSIIELSEDAKSALTRSVYIYTSEYLGTRIMAVEYFASFLEKNPELIQNKELLKEKLITMSTFGGDLSEFYVGFEDDGSRISLHFKENANVDAKIQTPQKDNYDARTRSWYKQAVAKNGLTFTAPFVSTTTGKFSLVILKPIIINGKVAGVVGTDVFIDDLGKLLDRMKNTENSIVTITDMGSQKLYFHPDKEYVMSDSATAKSVVDSFMENFNRVQEHSFHYTNVNG
ncbi:cache domain-containing protein, partial [Campylobacter mucosalis]